MSAEGTVNMVRHKLAEGVHHVTSLVPEQYRGELWIYAAGYIFLYTLLMLFTMSTFGFICVMIYIILLTMLILRYFGLGPLVSGNS